jgi:hypothetical protein
MIVSPLLLELGVHPLVAASTSSLMVRPCSGFIARGRMHPCPCLMLHAHRAYRLGLPPRLINTRCCLRGFAQRYALPLVLSAVSRRQVLFSASTAALALAFDHLLNVTYALVYGIGASSGPHPGAAPRIQWLYPGVLPCALAFARDTKTSDSKLPADCD